ncbi:TldD/PmbA family protein [Candidatus Bipolaricaulota bacterium]|nr:TldD/PmbA family protein [Candidatus Bipolaricaulota bacterium]
MKLLETAGKKADSAEVYEVKGNSIPVKFSSGELESVKHVETTGAALRVIDGGKLGFSTTTDPENLTEVVDHALETANFGEEADFEFPGQIDLEEVNTFDREIAELEANDLIKQGEEVIERLHQFDSDLEVNLDLSKSVSQTSLASSNGLEVDGDRTKLSLSLEIKKVGNEDIFTFHESSVGQKLDQFDVEKPTERAIQKLKWAERETRLESGSYPVILTPRGTLVLLVPLLAGFNGKHVFQGTSPMEGSLGEKAFAEELTISDYGSMKGSPTRRSFDDEGTPIEKVDLISRGEVKNFLYDLQTASRAGKEPTGNGLKGGLLGGSDFRSAPGISPTTLTIASGEKKFGEMISDIDRGLVVDQVLGLGQGNVLSGEFSNNVSVAYKVEDGAITGKVKDTMIAGNVYKLLKQNLELGKEAEWVGGGLFAPALRLDDVNVVRKS